MKWRVAKSLDKLLDQLNDLYPNRSKASDGSIGDAAHASRKSDHNPWVKKIDGTGIVTARDFTHDPDNGINGNWLCATLVSAKDIRLKYVIWDRHIYNVKDGFQKRPYTGLNAHKHHVHVSVRSDLDYDSESPWNLDRELEIPKQPVTSINLKKGDEGEEVTALQTELTHRGLLLPEQIDGKFGPKTERAVKSFQLTQKLRVDGIAGKNTLGILGVKF